MAFAMISGGITMLGIAQALRLLVGIILEGFRRQWLKARAAPSVEEDCAQYE
jgi:hypothetical protein